MRKTLALLLILALLPLMPVQAQDTGYSDVPAASWAIDIIAKAGQWGLMEGTGQGLFGYGQQITRAQFVAVLCRMLGWEQIRPESPSLSDVTVNQWYYPYIETALVRGVIDAVDFYPNEPILRQDMAVMLVKALGYETLAAQVSGYGHPFTDVEAALDGYIAIAYDIGMITGTSATTFAPLATAKREEAAAMLVRVYERLHPSDGWVHGFYAFSSYDQRHVIADMDAISFGWSNLRLDEEGVWLNTGSAHGNQRRIPAAYQSIVLQLEEWGMKGHLDVFMDTSQTLTAVEGAKSPAIRTLLSSAEYRTAAVDAILSEATRIDPELGYSPYSGVTIDFECLRIADREGFTAFLILLSSRLKAQGMTLYVALHPATADGIYYDGYDYRAIGALADKVILMAHDYQATDLTGFEGSNRHKTTALTPLYQVYYALRAITDSVTGVEDRSKIALAISFSSVAWETDDEGKLINPTPYIPTAEIISQRLAQPDTVQGWSEQFQNPWASYRTEIGQNIFLWYENQQSVNAKQTLAHLFGITGISYWRIGLIPDYGNYAVRILP